MTDFINKNDRQMHFNKVRGLISELNEAQIHCSVTIIVGHENPRPVNLYCKRFEFDKFKQRVKIGDKVTIMFYLASRLSGDRWNTYANILSIEIDTYKYQEPVSPSVELNIDENKES